MLAYCVCSARGRLTAYPKPPTHIRASMQSPKFVGSIDQGTTSTRFIIWDRSGRAVACEQQEHAQIMPRPGYVEHDASEIWRRTQEVITRALRSSGLKGNDLAAIGITNQRETTVAWDAVTGLPLHNALVWQDTRTQAIISALDADAVALLRTRAGLRAATYFSGSKMQWLLEQPEVASAQREGRLKLGTIDSWLLWNLTGGCVHATDVTNASRTLLMDLQTLQWDPELMSLFGVPLEALPAIKPSSHVFGHTLSTGALGFAVPIAGILGDQQAALVGQTCFEPGQSKTTYGTGNFLLLNTGTSPVWNDRGLLTTVAYQFGSAPCVYALEGSVAVTGSAIQWLRDQLGIISSAAETESLARSVPDNGGVYFVPAFSGLYAPHWCSSARGTVVGLSRASTKAHLARAALEAICYQTKEIMDCMVVSSKVEVTELRVDGGVTSNSACMQLQANIMGVPVILPCVTETTALGAAFAAGVAVGVWSGLEELKTLWQEQRRWMADAEDVGVVSGLSLDKQACDVRRAEGFRMWQRAVERSKDWVE